MKSFPGEDPANYDLFTWAIALCFFMLYVLMIAGRVSNKKLPPAVPGSFFELSGNFFSEHGPMWLLDVCRRMGKAIELPITPPTSSRLMVLTEPNLARSIMENPKNKKFQKAYSSMDFVSGGENMFSDVGSRARHARKSTSATFSPHCLPQMERIVRKTLDEWIEKKFKKDEQILEITTEMQLFSLQVASRVVLGFALPEDDLKTALGSFATTNLEFGSRVPKNPLRLLFRWALPEVREAFKAASWLQGLTNKMLGRYKEEMEGTSPRSKDMARATVMHHILNDQEYRDDQERMRDLLVYMAGGWDTVSNTITWALLELASKPHVQQWLQQELSKAKHNEEEARHDCTALSMVIRETLRLHTAPAMATFRVPNGDTFLPNGKVIPAKSVVQMPLYVIHRDADVFDDPDNFVPTRWENPTQAMQRAFMPFAVGRRSCPGQLLANTEARIVLSRLCADYEWTVVQKGRVSYCVTLKAVDVLLKAKKRVA